MKSKLMILAASLLLVGCAGNSSSSTSHATGLSSSVSTSHATGLSSSSGETSHATGLSSSEGTSHATGLSSSGETSHATGLSSSTGSEEVKAIKKGDFYKATSVDFPSAWTSSQQQSQGGAYNNSELWVISDTEFMFVLHVDSYSNYIYGTYSIDGTTINAEATHNSNSYGGELIPLGEEATTLPGTTNADGSEITITIPASGTETATVHLARNANAVTLDGKHYAYLCSYSDKIDDTQFIETYSGTTLDFSGNNFEAKNGSQTATGTYVINGNKATLATAGDADHPLEFYVFGANLVCATLGTEFITVEAEKPVEGDGLTFEWIGVISSGSEMTGSSFTTFKNLMREQCGGKDPVVLEVLSETNYRLTNNTSSGYTIETGTYEFSETTVTLTATSMTVEVSGQPMTIPSSKTTTLDIVDKTVHYAASEQVVYIFAVPDELIVD